MDIPITYLERIRAMRPDLSIKSARQMPEAGDNDVIVIDGPSGACVFRFAKTEERRRRMVDEMRLLALIRDRTILPVPNPIMYEADVMVYPRIEGEPLTAWLIASLNDATQQRLADQLGTFLRALHSTPKSAEMPMPSPGQYRAYVERRLTEVRGKLYPHLMAFQREWVERLFGDALCDPTFFEHEPVLIHNDFKVDHILFDAKSQRINGVIDFGWACYGDPSIDICNLLQWYGESFVSRMAGAYPEMRLMMPRARFSALGGEVDWLMDGLEPGGQHWFFANLATNRDIRFPIIA